MRKEIDKKKQEDTKKAILTASKQIIESEGFEGVSIRKIAKIVGYSPGNIYQYFKNKDEIIGFLIREGYQNILRKAKKDEKSDENPEATIKNSFTSYINEARKNSLYYKAVMLNDNPNIIKETEILKQGITKTRESLKILKNQIEKGINEGRFKNLDSELTAQIIWTSSFGLLIKTILEKDLEENQIERLIEHHFHIIFNGIIKKDFNEQDSIERSNKK